MVDLYIPPENILIHDPYTLFPSSDKAFPLGYLKYKDPKVIDNHEYLDETEDPFGSETPPILLPYQQRWLADESKFKLWVKSRRIGASFVDSLGAVLNSSATNGTDSFYTGYNLQMCRQYINDCAYWAKMLQIATGEIEEYIYTDERKDILSYKIKFASGYEIIALSSRPENFRSKKGRVTIDEAAFVELGELLKAALALLMWGGTVNIISTHNGISTVFNQLINESKTGERDISLHSTTIDDALEEGLYKRICLVSNQEWTLEKEFAWRSQVFRDYGVYADEELLCIPSTDSDCLFQPDVINRCFIGEWEEPKKNHFYTAAIDPAFGGADNFFCGIFDITSLPYKLVAEYCQSRKSSETNQESSKLLIKSYGAYFLAIEKNAGGNVIAENFQKLMPNLEVELFTTTHTSKILATDSLATTMSDGDLIVPADWGGKLEFETFSKKLRECPVTGHDDRVMGLSIWRINLARALELKPRRSKPVTAQSKIQNIKI